MKNFEKYMEEMKEELKRTCGKTDLREKALAAQGKTCHGENAVECYECDVIFANWLYQDAE